MKPGALSVIDQAPKAACSTPHVTPQSGSADLDVRKFRGRAAVVTLGCAKNQVDSEVMLGVLEQSGFEIVTELQRADVAVVNTCGFLESSVRESIDCILEVADLKKSAQLRRLIVAGCMVERYRGDIKKTLPEVDAFIAVDDILNVAKAAEDGVQDLIDSAARPYFLYDDSMPRRISTPSHFAYVKISEGCNRPCTFCIIPKLRGAMRSRSHASVLSEAGILAQSGVREINLVAQDLTDYGADRRERNAIVKLLQDLDSARSVEWIRLLYAYPVGVSQELLDTIVALPRVCNYLDIPLQHASESVLKRMQRPVGRYASRKLTEFIRKSAPQIHIRTTFIVGFPGETEADVAELEAFVQEGHFENVGVFTYSQEEGTPAGTMDQQIPEKEKRARRERIMLAQQAVTQRKLNSRIGSEIRVLIEGPHQETDLLLSARAYWQAPEVDGVVLINDALVDISQDLRGRFGVVRVEDAAGYDLVGTLVDLEVATPDVSAAI